MFTGKLLQYHFSFLFLRWKISKMHIPLQSISENKSGFIFFYYTLLFFIIIHEYFTLSKREKSILNSVLPGNESLEKAIRFALYTSSFKIIFYSFLNSGE